MNNAVKFVVALFTLTLPGWINFQKNDPQPKHKEMDIYNQKQLNKEVDNWENMEMEKNTVLERVKNKTKPETKMNSENLKLMDELLFTPTFTTLSGSFPLGTVVILLLIHTCGAELENTKSKLQNDLKMKEQDHNDVTNALSETKTKPETRENELMQELEDVKSKTPAGMEKPEYFSESTWHTGLVGALVGLVLDAIITAFIWCCCRRDKTKRQNQNELPENESQSLNKSQHDSASSSTILEDLETELKNQRVGVNDKLQQVDMELKKNKSELQSVEDEIARKETEFDKPEELLRQKENLLNSQWKLYEMKKNYERQSHDIDKLFELLESLAQITTITNQDVHISVE